MTGNERLLSSNMLYQIDWHLVSPSGIDTTIRILTEQDKKTRTAIYEWGNGICANPDHRGQADEVIVPMPRNTCERRKCAFCWNELPMMP